MHRGKAPAKKWVPTTAERVPDAAEWVPAGQQTTRQHATTSSAALWRKHATAATADNATATNDATTAGNATTDDDATADDATTVLNGSATRSRATVGHVTGRGREWYV